MKDGGRVRDLSTVDVALLAGAVIVISEFFGKLTTNSAPIFFAFCLLAILVSIKMCWNLRSRRWFIPFFSAATLAHVPLVLLGRATKLDGFYLMAVPLIGLDVFLVISAALKLDDREVS